MCLPGGAAARALPPTEATRVEEGQAPRPDTASAPTRERSRLDAETYVRRGFEYAARPRPEDQREAERLFRKALAIRPEPATAAAPRAEPPSPAAIALAHAGLARVGTYLYGLGLDETPARLQQALEEGRRAVEIAPREARARSALALALVVADRLTPAEHEARAALEIDPDLAEAHLALSHVLRLRHDHSAALAAAQRAAARAPSDPRVLTGLGDALRESGLHRDAMEMYGQAVDLDHEAVAPQLGAAASLVKTGRFEKARATYNLILGQWDYGAERARLGGAALLIQQEQFEDALQLYEEITLPDNGSLPTILALYGKAYCLQRLGRDAEAEYFLSQVVGRIPRDYDGPARGREMLFLAYDDLVRFFAVRDRGDRLETLLREAHDRPLAPARFARRLAERLAAGGRAAEAGALLETALPGSDPGEDPLEIAQAALDLARYRSGGGRRGVPAGGPAGRALRFAADRIGPGAPGVSHYRLARAFALAGDEAEAIRQLGLARDGGYLPIDLMTTEADFSRLRDDPAFVSLAAPAGGR